MNFINGKKSWIGLGAGALSAALMAFGVITVEQGSIMGVLAGALLGTGIIHKFEKGQRLMTEIILELREKSAIILAVLAGAAIMLPSWQAEAKDCNFESGINARLVRVAWPAAIGVSALGFVDVEFGIAGFTSVCGNVSANILGGLCWIPQVRAALPLCPKDEEDPEESE